MTRSRRGAAGERCRGGQERAAAGRSGQRRARCDTVRPPGAAPGARDVCGGVASLPGGEGEGHRPEILQLSARYSPINLQVLVGKRGWQCPHPSARPSGGSCPQPRGSGATSGCPSVARCDPLSPAPAFHGGNGNGSCKPPGSRVPSELQLEMRGLSLCSQPQKKSRNGNWWLE